MIEADSRFVIFHRQKLHAESEKLFLDLRSKLCDSMQPARKISLCTDIWSKTGFTASFLGITCHYFNDNKKKKYHITLAVRHFPSPHTADRVLQIFQPVIEEW